MSCIKAIDFNNHIYNTKEQVNGFGSKTELFCFNAEEKFSDTWSKVQNEPEKKTNKIKKNIPRTVLNSNEKILYAKIHNFLSEDMQDKLYKCLNSGKLLNSESNDNSTVLDNLYKIISIPRTSEVDSKIILNECINIIDNPLIVTQYMEDIPKKYMDEAAEYVYGDEEKCRQERKEIAKYSNYMRELILYSGEEKLNKEQEIKRIKNVIENTEGGTCVAASIEFVFASKYPAEFIRIIEGLTSKNKSVKKVVDCKRANLVDDEISIFATPYNNKNGKKEFILRTDGGAYVLAKIQKECQNEYERTSIDILFQSLVFQIASQGTYNSITDTHSSLFNKEGGLNSTEKEYALKILTGRDVKGKLYRNYNNKKLCKNADNKIIEKDIEKELKKGKLIMISINCSNDKNILTDGHEITIISKQKKSDGKEYYVCKDSDELESTPLYVEKDILLDQIFYICTIK